jgi:hypothetical protein
MFREASQTHRLDTDLLTDEEASEQELPMSLAWYRRRRIRGGGPPFIRISTRVFYRRGDLRRWIASQGEATAPNEEFTPSGRVESKEPNHGRT